MQHVIVTATATGVSCAPDPIQIYRDDQFIRFSLGKDTAWGNDAISFGDTWPGGAPMLDVSGTFIANANTPLPATITGTVTYGVTFRVTHTPTGNKFTHDPEVENQPQP
ncbi:MAG: hypothetical protein M3P06_15020 [Acidobacteriota bacterium]|nr:hypothetical protein [Acidobacteriota bacterium]